MPVALQLSYAARKGLRRDLHPHPPEPGTVLRRPARADLKLLMSSDLIAQESEPRMILKAREDRTI